MLDALFVVVKYPLLLGLFGFDIFVVIPFLLFSASMFGYTSLLVLAITQSPVIFMIIQEERRKRQTLPMTDRWETSQERWLELLDEYTETVDNKKHDSL